MLLILVLKDFKSFNVKNELLYENGNCNRWSVRSRKRGIGKFYQPDGLPTNRLGREVVGGTAGDSIQLSCLPAGSQKPDRCVRATGSNWSLSGRLSAGDTRHERQADRWRLGKQSVSQSNNQSFGMTATST